MADPKAGFDPQQFQSSIGAASAALQDFAQGAAKKAADDAGASFEQAGVRIARALGNAAAGGEASFKRLTKTILEELAKLALDKIFASIGLSTSGGAKEPFFGAKAGGGAVNPGGSYLVGEQGPEWFTPTQSGSIAANAAPGAVNVHFHLGAGADAQSIQRNQGQIAAAIARVVAYGRRNL